LSIFGLGIAYYLKFFFQTLYLCFRLLNIGVKLLKYRFCIFTQRKKAFVVFYGSQFFLGLF